MADKSIYIGMDVGFRKTGITVFRLGQFHDELLEATTVTTKDVAESVINQDAFACMNWYREVAAFVDGYDPYGLFAEIPHGGAQGARANRCMGMATALISAFLQPRRIRYELFSPLNVEKALGVNLTRGQLQEKGLKKGEATAWKKERLANAVLQEWPSFEGWPKTKALREDAIDSAAAFMCGRKISKVYKGMRDSASS